MPGVDSLQAGLWVPPGAPFCGQAAPGLVPNRAMLMRFPCPRSMSISKIAFFIVAAATADDPCDVGIYDSAANPVNRLGSSGSVLGQLNSTGMKQVSLTAPVALVQGQIYYAAFAVGAIGGTGAIYQGTQTDITGGGRVVMFGTVPPYLEHGYNATGHPLPATLAIGAIGNAPIMALLQ